MHMLEVFWMFAGSCKHPITHIPRDFTFGTTLECSSQVHSSWLLCFIASVCWWCE